MNSRKWQLGMVALIVLTLGLGAFAPFLWRALRLKETAAFIMTAVVLVLEILWFLFSSIQDSGALDGSNPAGLFGVVAIIVALFGTIWMFRPYRKEEITDPWAGR